MYRAVDSGMRSIDIRSLTEAAQSLGASWFTILLRIILPNLRVALLSGAFLSLAIVIGEYTIAAYLVRPAFGPYLSLLGANRTYEPAAVTLISFGHHLAGDDRHLAGRSRLTQQDHRRWRPLGPGGRTIRWHSSN